MLSRIKINSDATVLILGSYWKVGRGGDRWKQERGTWRKRKEVPGASLENFL